MASTVSPGIFIGATAGTAGTSGIVPLPNAGTQNAFLRGDSTWASPAALGFVTGPAGSVDGTIAIYAGASGTVIRDTGVSIDASNNITGVAAFNCTSATVGALSGVVHAAAGVLSAGNVDLTSQVTGVLPIANGGTNGNTATAGFDNLSPLTTKGDLVVFNGTHNVRLPAGSNGQVLQANNLDPNGVTWTTNPSGSYDTVDNAGIALTQRNTLNFSGTGITAVDNAGATRTDVALSGTVLDIAGLTPTANTIVYGNGTHFTNSSTLVTNTYYVSKNGNDATGNGSREFPYLTIGAACTAIGNATTVIQFNDTTQRYYTIYIDAGIYVEAVTIPSRPDVIFDMHGSVIQGNVTQDLDRTLLTGGLNTAKVSFIGYDMRGAHSGLTLPKIGVDGDITMTSSVGANNFTSLYLINTGVTGNVLFSGINPGYQGFLFTQNTNISGSINTDSFVNINMYLNQAATSSTAGIGGCSGACNFSAVNNINFNGPVITSTNQAGRLWNTQFKAGQAHNFTGATGTFTMDANTYDSYFNNVATKGGETIVLMDTARGVNAAYTPLNYTAATVDVRANLAGIDTALGTKAAKGANSDITSLSGLSTPLSTAQGGTGVASPTAHGIMVAEGASAVNPIVLGNGQLLIGSNGADPVAATITAGTGISVVNNPGSITINSTGAGSGGITWNDTTGTSATLAAGNGYFADNIALVTFTLPATATMGDVYKVQGKGTGKWKIAQNAGQQIFMINNNTTVGVGGSISSSGQYDSIEITAFDNNNFFVSNSNTNAFTIV